MRLFQHDTKITAPPLPASAFTSDSFPPTVGIETINACNARCPFCPLFGEQVAPMDRRGRKATVMCDELFDRCITDILSWPVLPSLIFLNMDGEPLTDPKICDRLRMIEKSGRGALVCLQSNAQFLREEPIIAILKAGIREITIGFDGATKEVYELHRVGCTYETVLDNVRNFVRLRSEMGGRTRVVIKFVRTSLNVHEVAGAYELFRQFLNPHTDSFIDIPAVDWGDQQGDNSIYYIKKSVAGGVRKMCASFLDQMIIHSDGTLAACCWDYNLNVSDGGFGKVGADARPIDIWQGEKRMDLRRRLETGDADAIPAKCRTCPNLYESRAAESQPPAFDDGRTEVIDNGFVYRFSHHPQLFRILPRSGLARKIMLSSPRALVAAGLTRLAAIRPHLGRRRPVKRRRPMQ